MTRRAELVYSSLGGQAVVQLDVFPSGSGPRGCEPLQLVMPVGDVRCEAGLREQLGRVLAAQPKVHLRLLGRKTYGELRSQAKSGAMGEAKGGAMQEWCRRLALTCYSPYGEQVPFPSHFADLTMWVARVEARAHHVPRDGAKGGSRASPKGSPEGSPKVPPKPPAKCLKPRQRRQELHSMDLEARTSSTREYVRVS